MKKYIVTGGEGFIGSKIVAKTDSKSFDLKSCQDILNKKQFLDFSLSAEGVFHCAAKISVPESIQKPDEYYLNNVKGTKSVADAANQNKIKIVFSSSAAVYGDSNLAVSENSIFKPKSPYAKNKIDAEAILKKLQVPVVALRYFNVYGPGQSDAYAGVITNFIKRALKGEDILINGNGMQVRDFIFVDDIVEANIVAMNYSKKDFEVFNIVSGIPTTILQLAEKIILITNSSSKIKHGPKRQGDILYSLADISKTKNILGWTAKTSLEKGLKKTIDYCKNFK